MWETALEMDESETVSSWRVSMPDDWAWVSLDVLRAVAKTRQPALWKAMARAQPRPPSEQPVMRTVLFAKTMVIFVMQIGAGLNRTRCIWEDALNLSKAFASRAPPFLLFNNEFSFTTVGSRLLFREPASSNLSGVSPSRSCASRSPICLR